MRRFADRLVLASFLVHLVFGCCIHHARVMSASAHSVGVETSCPCQHHEQEPGGQHEQPQHHDHECDGQTCVFTRAKTVDAPGPSTDRNFVALTGDLPELLQLCRGDAAESGCRDVGTSVALHLLNQAFLL